MRRVRNYLRITVSAQVFSSLGLQYIERDLSRDIKAHDVVAEYASYGSRRL